MGGGRWDSSTYRSTKALRSSRGEDDFAYTQTARREKKVNPNLDPKRINDKKFGKLESRDSAEHPESNAILVCFDVTGSNVMRAREAQLRLSSLMGLLEKYIPDPQIAMAANDDYEVEPELCTQISDFESDIRIDEHLRNIALVGNGGGNAQESYDLLLYAAARKTVLDCVEKRKRKGYLFIYADEPFPWSVNKTQVRDVFGDQLEANIPIQDIIAEAGKLYNVYLISTVNPVGNASQQYRELFGERVLVLQDPSQICELIASVVGFNEKNRSKQDVIDDLVNSGMSKDDAAGIVAVAGRKFRDIPASPAA